MPILGFLKPIFSLSRKACLLYKRSKIVFHVFFYHLLHGNTLGYKGLHGVKGVTGGYKGVHGVTKGYRGLQEVTRGYRGLQRTIETFF